MLVFFSRIPLDDVPGSCQPFLFEFRVDDAYLDWRVCTVCTLDQSCAGQRHVMYHAGYRLSACGGICSVRNRHRYQHHLVPVGIVAVLVEMIDESRDVVERIRVGRRCVSGQERRLVVHNLVVLKEGAHLRLGNDEQCGRSTKRILAGSGVVDALQRNLGRRDILFVVTGEYLVYGQGHLGEDSGGRLQIGAAVVVGQLCDVLAVGDGRSLQHLFGTGKRYDTFHYTVFVYVLEI
jgi:hypothetical protein